MPTPSEPSRHPRGNHVAAVLPVDTEIAIQGDEHGIRDLFTHSDETSVCERHGYVRVTRKESSNRSGLRFRAGSGADRRIAPRHRRAQCAEGSRLPKGPPRSSRREHRSQRRCPCSTHDGGPGCSETRRSVRYRRAPLPSPAVTSEPALVGREIRSRGDAAREIRCASEKGSPRGAGSSGQELGKGHPDEEGLAATRPTGSLRELHLQVLGHLQAHGFHRW